MSAETSASSGPQRRRERERAQARASILAAARDLARAEGWDAVTMRRLAEKIEYSSNFAYRYFAGRDDILLAVVRDGFSRLRDAMTAAADAGTGHEDSAANEVAVAVRRAAHAYLDFALAEPELYQVMYGLGGVHVPTADTFADGEAVGEVLVTLLTEGGDEHAFEHVLQLWATAHGLIALLAVGRLDVDVNQLRTLADAALDDVLARALLVPGPAGRVAPSKRARS
jgi:AcrR family transcriptional regulator